MSSEAEVVELHCVPENDLVNHQTCRHCVCGPQPIIGFDPANAHVMSVIYKHHSLDGREKNE